ncbi:unnamed protein product [Prorocentrum cordatum]|uniref:RRM domain-containing protein n=1 Tax=Prorocentrum cordatum TaxID=2364126 RepID=A0ABN9VB36_9DINO|nr:unnamed protein product [Polarella glacialis]
MGEARQEQLLASSRTGFVNPKKSREVYLGNLERTITVERVRRALLTLFSELPAYVATYPDISSPLVHITLHVAGMGAYAFAEFFDSRLASTAIQFSGLTLHGKVLSVRRPQGYVVPPQGEAAPLDVGPLRVRGLLPAAPSNAVSVANDGKQRELFFGNLPPGKVTAEVILRLVNPVLEKLPEWRPQEGNPITNIDMVPNGTYAFVQFQSVRLACKVIEIFDGQELFGNRMRVRHTEKGLPAWHASTRGPIAVVQPARAEVTQAAAQGGAVLAAPFTMPPPPPGGPPPVSPRPPVPQAPPAPPEVQWLGEQQLLQQSLALAAPAAGPPAPAAPPAAAAAPTAEAAAREAKDGGMLM